MAALSPARRAVLRALTAVHRERGTTVQTADVIGALEPTELELILQHYKIGVSSAVNVNLRGLCRSGQAFSPGRVGYRRHWGATAVSAPEPPFPPDAPAQRQRVYALVSAAVERLGRGVRFRDVMEQARIDTPDLAASNVSYGLRSLAKTGQLVVVGKVVGLRTGGTRVYLPSCCDPAQYPVEEVGTPSTAVLVAFHDIWQERVSEAIRTGTRPSPVLTAEIRERLGRVPAWAKDPKAKQHLLAVLGNSARSATPRLRKLRYGSRVTVAWVPVGVPNDELDLAKAYTGTNDVDRVAEALKRACARLRRPLATPREVAWEMAADPTLQMVYYPSVGSALSNASRRQLVSRGRVHPRKTSRVCVVGQVNGVACYAPQAQLAAAGVYLPVLVVEASLRLKRVEKQVAELGNCTILQVARARAHSLQGELDAAISILSGVASDEAVEEDARVLLAPRINELMGVRERLFDWTRFAPADERAAWDQIPASHPSWLPEELHAVAALLTGGPDPTRPRGNPGWCLRKLPNPDYVDRHAAERRQAAPYLFDRAEALIRLATTYAGGECRQQGILAYTELGTFRNPDLVLPSISSPALEERLAAVGCLAFLWSSEGLAALRRAAVSDMEPGVRRSALWAYGFAGGTDAMDLLRSASTDHSFPYVREFACGALAILAEDPRGWWAL